MEDNRNQVENALSDQAKVISLFQFIQELNKLKQKAILNVKDYPWSFSLSDLPDDPENISLHFQDRVSDDLDSEKAEDGNLILSVHKPEFRLSALNSTSLDVVKVRFIGQQKLYNMPEIYKAYTKQVSSRRFSISV